MDQDRSGRENAGAADRRRTPGGAQGADLTDPQREVVLIGAAESPATASSPAARPSSRLPRAPESGATARRFLEEGARVVRGDAHGRRLEETVAALTEREAFGRYAEPWEVAIVIVFLASGYSSYMTGETVSVSGQHA
ncbi:hypothetical protein SANT12839_085750 [Streptomyces antimycoticus]|uniref:Uncharacterized protein n=1 Tax=Streptomyces antimycoticus TaxID=68175 RepID=A0A4D4KP94_9ACTN|nr:hypothetical protein SANT12839_085750 [Streptomyces antimycoticus]